MTKDSRAIVLSFAYSLSPKVQHAAVALEDRYNTLEWLLDRGNGSLLGANPSKLLSWEIQLVKLLLHCAYDIP